MNEDIKQFTSNKLWESNNPTFVNFITQYEFPWEAVINISDFIVDFALTLSDDFIEIKEQVYVHKTASIDDSVILEGPCIIDANAIVRAGAYVREYVYIGERAIIGNSAELKNSIIMDEAEIGHFNYVGDSILGKRAHLGGGAIISNFRQDRSFIKIHFSSGKLETGMEKFGTLLGDYVEVGANAVINPGTLVGRNSRIYPLTQTRVSIPENSLLKNDGKIYKLNL